MLGSSHGNGPGGGCSRRPGAGDPLAEVLDIREVAQSLFTKAKEFLQEHGCLPSAGLVLNATSKIEVVDLDGHDKATRRQHFREFRQKGQNATAVASFIIRDTTY